MPNYVRNEIQMKGIADMPIFHDKGDEYGEHAIDFDKIVPMPEELDVPSGSAMGEAIAWYMTERGTADPARYDELANAVPSIEGCVWMRHFKEDGYMASLVKDARETVKRHPEEHDKLYEAGHRYVENFRKYGYGTWYDWCCENWGTKWNAQDSYAVDDGTVWFSTAWDPALPIAKKLSEMRLNTEVILRWADEDIGYNTGCATFLNGKGKVKRPANGSNEALALYVHLWGEDDCLEQDMDGNWHIIDEDDEAC